MKNNICNTRRLAMITVEKYFEEKINDLLLSCTNKTLYFFKGFSKEQILYLSKHEKCVLGYNEIIAKDNEENIDILRINDKWLEIIQNISNSDCALIGFYEELIAIKDFLPRIEVDNIVIIENNLLEPWQPIYISHEKAIELFDFFREDKEPVNKEINILSQYYGDVRILNKENILILPVTVDNEQIKHIPFWTNRTIEHVEYSSTEKIEFNSDEDWLFRLKITNGIRESVTYLCEDDKAIQTMDISAALSSLKIPFCIESKNKIKKSKHYNYDRFTPILKKYWGEEAQFRDLSFYKDPDRSYETEEISQGNIIAEIVQQCEDAYFGKNFCNIFITAPTGAGKSLLFQLPSIYMAEQYSTITIVISPLIALMNDQVIQLRQERNVSIAACINSTMTIEERISVTEKIKNGEISLLYLAPELLLTTHLQTFLGGRKIGLLVIDEAHTVTSWGRDFRADYWFLGDFLKKLKRDNMSFPVLCLTATAVYSGEDDVVNDTIQELNLENTIIHIGDVKRKNIEFDIIKHEPSECRRRIEDEKIDMTLNRVNNYIANSEKTLVYFPYRSQVDQIYSIVSEKEMRSINRYHGQLHSNERKIIEKNHRNGNTMALLCTKAFGMGVDVSDITHVVHFAPTGTLADYVQEVGRAARNPDIKGHAHIDYFPSDMRYVRSLNGISEMRQYQLKEMLKKINSIYQKKKHRNLLISTETFSYLFPEKEVENRTKTGLLLLAKDLQNKYSFPVLIVRPKAMLSQNYICVPYEIEDIFLEKYGQYVRKQSGQNRRVVYPKDHGKEVETTIYSVGDTYLVDMASIWENYFKEYTFGMFKKIFFDKIYDVQGKKYNVTPRVRIEIKYKEQFEIVAEKAEGIMNAVVNILTEFKNSESKQFTAKMFEERLNELIGEKTIQHDKISLLLDIFIESVDENAMYSRQRSQIRVIRQRKQSNHDETVYFVSNSAYTRLTSYFNKMLEQCKPNIDNDVFCRFYSLRKDKSIELMPILRMLELLNLASYEIRGGEKAEVFIRINDPSKIQRLANCNYKNTLLQSIRSKHKRNEILLNAFFMSDIDNETRWHLIEDYFLGNEDAVRDILQLSEDDI